MDISIHNSLLESVRMINKNGQPESERGTTLSYIIGFLLSLVFTAIPYYLVVNKVISGATLLATILGFAFLQMAIQIFFFLHLGRGPKPLYNVVFFFSTMGIILVVIGGSIFIINSLQYNMSPRDVTKKLAQDESIYQVGGEKTGACQVTLTNHKVTISNGKVSPRQTQAHLCDTLTFINEDETVREMSIGTHPDHQAYSGNNDLKVIKNHPKTFTLNQAGTYLFHDHLNPAINGEFAITP